MTSPQLVFKAAMARDFYEHARSSFSHRGKKERLNSCSTAESRLQIVTLGTFLTTDQSNWDSIMRLFGPHSQVIDRSHSLASLGDRRQKLQEFRGKTPEIMQEL
jgi:hypothetical protein